MSFNRMQDDDPAHYQAFVASLVGAAAQSLEAAKGHPAAVHAAIEEYLRKGYGAGLTSGELTDFFCVDTPSVLDRARYSEIDADAAVRIFDRLNSAYRRTELR